MHPHLAGNETVHYVSIFQLHFERCIGEVLDNLTLHFDVIFFCHLCLLDHRCALEVCLLQETFILVRHDIGLNLRHEVHRYDNDDQQ